MSEQNIFAVETVFMKDADSNLVILDQTLLPGETKHIELKTQKEIWDAIYLLQVRGAPAIGVAAAFGIYMAAREIEAADSAGFLAKFLEAKAYLASSRPTAVNLFWALDRMERRVRLELDKSVAEIKAALYEEAVAVKEEDIWVCRTIGEYGQEFVRDDMGILTHCNAGTLATARFGTALAPIYVGQEKGYKFRVFADETRPLLQGARLTAYELHAAGVDTTLICDNMASMVMKNGWVQAVFVGCDRVAANGDSANKIGTSAVAILAKYYGIPFYVCAPTSTIDLECPNGDAIHIEERSPEEVTEMWYSKRMAPEGIKVYNPAFDVAKAENITAIITEYGIARAPFDVSLREIFDRKAKAQKG